MIALTRMTQPVHWRQRYGETMDLIRRRPFAYGSHDCALGLVAAVVQAITGTDIAGPYRGSYTDQDGALALMKGAGFDNLADMVASLLPEIPEGVARAEVGDVVAIPDDGPFGWSLGIVNGERCFVLHETGLATVDLLTAKRAFKVG